MSSRIFLLVLFFFSGFTALVYQVLWLKELRLLFGNTAQAAATTLAAFFIGLALGSHFAGRRAARLANPIRTYALLELGIALAAGLYFLILAVYRTVYAPIFEIVGDNHAVFLAIKFVLALALLVPPAFLMGATLPVVGQHLARRRSDLGRVGTLLYAINTIGAAAGAFAAGFVLPPALGFRGSYLLAIGMNVLIAGLAWAAAKPTEPAEADADPPPAGAGLVLGLVFFSGFITLALEVLWTQMVAQVVVNSVYSFSLILVTFLVSLALGGLIAHTLCRRAVEPWKTLYGLMLLSGLLVGLTPFVFFHYTDGMAALAMTASWGAYVVEVLTLVAVTVLIPGTVAGSVFPFLLKLVETIRGTAGEALGRWIAVNTVGGVLGSLAAGFVLLDLFGLWVAIQTLAVAYLVLSLVIVRRLERRSAMPPAIPAVVIAAILLLSRPETASAVRLEPYDSLVDTYYGSHGVVSVVRSHPDHYPSGFDDLYIKLNNSYTLGGRGSAPDERRQTHLPLLIHPNPRSVYFLGLGTGMTAGAALHHPVERIVVTEKVPAVVDAARTYFSDDNGGVLDDPRVQVVVEDGRNYLAATSEKYDVIIGDLFDAWAAGTGTLYSREHYGIVRDRLEDGGLFAQWLPLFQLSDREFGTIVRTFLEVFPDATIWRGNFSAEEPTLALVGRRQPVPLDPARLIRGVEQLESVDLRIDLLASLRGLSLLVVNPEGRSGLASMLPMMTRTVPFTFYAGNLRRAEARFADYPINTDDWPVIEFRAPKALVVEASGELERFRGFRLMRFFDEMIEASPPASDPHLTALSQSQKNYVLAGVSYYKSALYSDASRQSGRASDLETAKSWFIDYAEKIELPLPPAPKGGE